MIRLANRVQLWLTVVSLVLLSWSKGLVAAQAGEVRYNVIKIIEGNGMTVPEAGGINQKGQVVGSMDTFGGSGFWLWSDGVRQDLPLGTNRNCRAVNLNNHGQVVGSFHTGQYGVDFWGIVYPIYHAFVWTAGSLQDLGTLGGEVSGANSINDQGIVLGSSDNAENNDRLPVIVQDGQMRSLQSLISNPGGWNLALETHYVAADGRVWGLGMYGPKYHIYEMTPETNGMYRIRSRGVIEGSSVKVFGFNEYGRAAGRVVTADLQGGGFFWNEHGMILLNDLTSRAYAINNHGQIVGATTFDSPSVNAFLWENGVMFNLNDLIPPDSGLLLTEAGHNAINDAGHIVCRYRNNTNGLFGVCLLVPVHPVPLEISHHVLTSAGLSLEVRGGAGQPISIEYTSDWAQWTTLAISTNLMGRRIFIDPDVRSAKFRAYRARLLAP
jgi:probable HAF family extracellular repeat protein